MTTWKSALKSRTDLTQYGSNALGLFALALRFGLEDLDTVASESLTDGSGDKKADIIYIDQDEGVAVIAQTYMAASSKREAPANKASDLNTAVAWLVQRPIADLPKRLQSPAAELRGAIIDGAITDLFVWYVHNCPESVNVQDELLTVEATLTTALKSSFPGREPNTQVIEVLARASLRSGTEILSHPSS